MNPHLIEDNEYDYTTYIVKKKKKNFGKLLEDLTQTIT